MEIDGTTAIVCGGSAGVGRATVEALVAQGCRVGVIARGQARLDALEQAFGAGPDGAPKVVTASADVADAPALDRAVEALVSQLGAPVVWVNCAMLTSFSPFEAMAAAEFSRIVDVTFIGQVNGCRAALRHMDRGTIVNVGSGLSYRAVPFQSAYCAAKHAINGFSASLRSELIRDGRGVAVSLVQLPALDTPQFDWARNRLDEKPQPAPPIFAPHVAADAIVRAARAAPRELLVGSSVLQLTAGQLVVPDWMDRKMAQAGGDMQKSGKPEPDGRPDNLYDPVAHPSSSTGSYTHRSKSSALVLDSDRARLASIATISLISALIGAALTSLISA